MKRIKDTFRIWLKDTFVVNRITLAISMLAFLAVGTLYVYMLENWPFTFKIVTEPWLTIAVVLSALLLIKFEIPESWKSFVGTILILVAPAIAFWGMEYMYSNEISSMLFVSVAVNYLAYLVVYIIFYIIFNRAWIAVLLGNAACFFFIVLNYHVLEFRGSPIRAYDILAVKTAMGVAGQYEIEINLKMTKILLYFLVCVLVALNFRQKRAGIKRHLVVAVVLISLLVCGIPMLDQDFVEKHNLKPNAWDAEESANEHGMMGDFVAGIPYLMIEEPDNYSPKLAKDLQTKGASLIKEEKNNENVKPDVIAIMNESFSDLSVLGDITTSVDCLEYFNSLSDNVVRGNLYVPIRGGTTCNSEFEFITGYTCAFLPAGTVAFQSVIKNGTYNLGADFSDNGYSSVYFHPYYAKGWNRSNVYPLFDFDSVYFMEDIEMQEEDIVKMYMTDEADYRILIEFYEEEKETQDNVFMFNVTMQNHGGYAWGMSEVQVLSPTGDTREAEEYFSLIKRSDDAFKELIEYYSQVEDPTVILMFGDHQPTLSSFTELLQAGTASDDIEGKMEEYCVPFVIWANYDIEEKYYEGISANYLSVVLKETVGQPLTEYQKYLKNLMTMYPVITDRAVKDVEDNWYIFEEAKEFDEIENYKKVQYWNLIDNCK